MSDKVLKLNSSNFDATISGDKPVMVDFWATWCGPCRMFGPTVDALAEEVGNDAVIGKLDVDEAPEIAAKYGINAVPTVIFFKKGQQVRVSGMASKEALKAKLKELA